MKKLKQFDSRKVAEDYPQKMHVTSPGNYTPGDRFNFDKQGIKRHAVRVKDKWYTMRMYPLGEEPTEEEELSVVDISTSRRGYWEHEYDLSFVPRRLTAINYYSNSGKTVKWYSEEFTYTALGLVDVITYNYYSDIGTLQDTLIQTYTYSGGFVASIQET